MQELSYFDQPNWTASENYVTEIKRLGNTLFNTTRYFMDGFGRTKQVQTSDHIRNLRMVSETSIYDSKGNVVRAYKPYYISQSGLDNKHDVSYASKTQALYGSNFAFKDVGFELKPEPVVSSVYAPKGNFENPIVSSQTEYMNTAALSHMSTSGLNTFPAGTLLVHEVIDPMGKIVRSYLNQLGQVIMEEHQIGMDHIQNPDGSISFTATDLGFSQTWFYYDGAGRIVATYDPENKKSSYFYNSLGVMVKSISPDKGTSELRYDKYGQVRFIRNQKDIDAVTANTYGTSQFKYVKYDVWGQTIESGVITTAPNNLGVSTTNHPFPTGDFFNNYTKINDQSYPKNTDKFVQVHVKNEYAGSRKFYNSTLATAQYAYSEHVLNTSTFVYNAAKTDKVTTTFMADGQAAKMGYLYDGLAGTHYITAVYNEMNLPVGKDYIHPTNAQANFQWRSSIDHYGRILTSSNIYNGLTTQVSKNYYDPLGSLLMVGFGTTSVANNPHIDYITIKKNVRDQVVSQMSKNYRVGLTYDASGNITNQYWTNELIEPSSASSSTINQYAYTYDNMNRLIGADYKQSILTSNPFSYYNTVNGTIPADFNCTIDGTVVASVFNTYLKEFQKNILNGTQVVQSTKSIDALNRLQSDYLLNNVQYSDMTTEEVNTFLSNYIRNCKQDKLFPEEFEAYEAKKAKDIAHLNYLNNNPLTINSLKYVKILLAKIPWTQPVSCTPNPVATAYSYLPSFPTPVAIDNSPFFDAAYWYQKNGNFNTLHRNNNTGLKTKQLYTYQNNTNKLAQASFQVGATSPLLYNYTYDAHGNLLTDSKNNVNSIQYSLFDDLPASMTMLNTSQHHYRYFNGKRSVKDFSDTEREYYIDNVVLDQNGSVKSYQTAAGYAVPGQSGTTANYFYHVKDWLGSTHVTLSSGGDALNAMDYYPYGKKMPARIWYGTNQEGYRYQYTGHEYDGETGYQYHGARYYDEELARYMSVDPWAKKFHAWSPYNYVMGNPVKLIDPTGKGPTDWVSVGGQIIYDSRVTDQQSATTLYGLDAGYRAPGYEYTSNTGNNIVLGENGHFLKNGVMNESPDNYQDPYLSQTDIAWNGSSGVGSENPSPFLANLRKPGNFDFNYVPEDAKGRYYFSDDLGKVFAVTMTFIVTAGVGTELGAAGYGAKEAGGFLWRGLKAYHSTFGSKGGYVNLGVNYLTQSASNNSFNPLDHNILEYGVSAFMKKDIPIIRQSLIGAGGGLVSVTPNSKDGIFKHAFNQNGSKTLLNVILGGTAPLYNMVPGGSLLGPVYQGVGGRMINHIDEQNPANEKK